MVLTRIIDPSQVTITKLNAEACTYDSARLRTFLKDVYHKYLLPTNEARSQLGSTGTGACEHLNRRGRLERGVDQRNPEDRGPGELPGEVNSCAHVTFF